jgi:molecular chaperone GrpE
MSKQAAGNNDKATKNQAESKHKKDAGKPKMLDIKEYELDSLKEQVAAKEEQLAQAKEAVLRLRADFDNLRKRSITEKEQIARRAREDVIAQILPVMDSFDRSLKSFEENHEAEQVFSGFMLIHKQMQDALKKLGVHKLDCAGQPFDANKHDALFHQESAEPPDTVLGVCQAGYIYNDKVMRPAQVILAKAKENK